MKNGLIYRLEWITAKDDITVQVNIYDTLIQIEDDEDPQVLDLIPAGTPLLISSIDNDENKFKVIRAKQATIRFLSDSSFDITTFASGPDNRWYVEIFAELETLFLGYLSLSDMSQDFLPNPNVVTLIATDHLGILKDQKLVNSDGENPEGLNKIAKYLSWCLRLTGLNLDIWVNDNLRHGTGELTDTVSFTGSTILLSAESSFFYHGQTITITGTASNNGEYRVVNSASVFSFDVVTVEETFVTESSVSATFTDKSSETHYYDTAYINAKDYESSIGESEDAYTVLEKILKFRCFICQYKGKWWVQSIDEFDSNQRYISIFDTDGIFQSNQAATDYNKDIGAAEDIVPTVDKRIEIVGQYGEARLEFPFDTASEIPCNTEFDRGEVIDDSQEDEKTYEVECWYPFRANYPTSDLIAATTSIYTKRIFRIPDYEFDRYVVIEQSSSPASNLIMSEDIPLKEKDRFNLTVSQSLSAAVSGSGDITQQLAQVRFYGDDGTFWTLHGGTIVDEVVKWVACTSTFTTNQQTIVWQGDASIDETEVISKTVEAPDAPADGYIKILLYQSDEYGDIRDTYIHPPVFEYIAYINGSYQKYVKQLFRDYRDDEDYKTKLEDTVYLADSPKPLFKGSQFIEKLGEELYSGSIQFAATDIFVLSGDVTATYRVNDYVFINSVTYEGVVKITDSTYNIIGNTTAVTFEGLTVGTVTENGTITKVDFILTSRWFTAAAFGNSFPPSPDYCKPFGKQQIDAVWNQYRNTIRVFTGVNYGLTEDWPDLIHKYSLTDSNANQNNRFFIHLNFEQDWKTCLWRYTTAEVYHTDGKVYDDPTEFKYVSSE